MHTQSTPQNYRLVKIEKMLILLPILLPVYETIITGKSEPCLVPGCQQEIKLRDRRRSIVGVIVRYTVKGSQWKIKDKIGNVVKLKLYYCSNSAMKNVENAGTSKKWLYFW